MASSSRAKKRRMETKTEFAVSEKCAHCEIIFSSKIRRISAIAGKGETENYPVEIKEALAFVFESLGTIEDFTLEESEFLSESDALLLCLKCANGLTSLYKGFKYFASLGSAESKINSKLTKLRCPIKNSYEEYIEYDYPIKEEPVENEFVESEDPNHETDETEFINNHIDSPEATIKEEPEYEVINWEESAEEKIDQNFGEQGSTAFQEIAKEIKERVKNPITFAERRKIRSPFVHCTPKLNCSNCAAGFSDNARKISAISVKGENGDVHVPIKKAMEFVFESVGEKLPFLKLKCNIFNADAPKDTFLCLNCALSLGQLYNTFKHFTDQGNPQSEIGKYLKILRTNWPGTLAEEKPPGTQCSNCNVKFEPKVRKISAISVASENKGNVPLPIKKALAFVFESFADSQNFQWKTCVITANSDALVLCLDCALSLGRLHKAFKHFADLGNSHSEIGRKLNRLKVLVMNDDNKTKDDSHFRDIELGLLSQYNKYMTKLSTDIQDNTNPGTSTSTQRYTESNCKSDSKTNAEKGSTTPNKAVTTISPNDGQNSDSECTTDDEECKREKYERSKNPYRRRDISSNPSSRSRSPTETHKCVLCYNQYSKKSWLLSHILIRHTEKSTFKCSVCNIRFPNKDKLALHMFTHEKGEKPPFSCEPCGANFLRDFELSRHVFQFHRNEEKCDICQKVFYTKVSINKHRPKCKINKLETTCQVCDQEFPSADDTFLHLESHNGQGPWNCRQCDSTCNMPINFQKHMKAHLKTGDMCCTICGKMFKNRLSIKLHEALHAENIPRPFKCTVENCQLTFKSAGQLQRHQKLHQLKATEKTFKCPVNNCNKSFLTDNNLKQHLHVHSDLKTNVCDFCGKKFNYRQNLRTHIKNMHSKNKRKSSN